MRMSGPNRSERFVAELIIDHELVPVREIALVRKETRKDPPGGDAL